jgi:hypothetical protein
LRPADAGTDVSWQMGGISFLPIAGYVDASVRAFSDAAQFEIDGTAVSAAPEPSSASMIVAAAICLIVFRKWRVQ